MTPKEKAVDILDSFYNMTPNSAWFNPPLGTIKQEYNSWEHAKENAEYLITEVLNVIEQQKEPSEYQYSYWLNVKKEIQKL